MNLNDYTAFARTTAIYPEAGSNALAELMYLSLGLAGEAGEVANNVKKLFRDGDDPLRREKLFGELGDVFWYLVRLCDACGFDPQQVVAANAAKLASRKERGALGGDGDGR